MTGRPPTPASANAPDLVQDVLHTPPRKQSAPKHSTKGNMGVSSDLAINVAEDQIIPARRDASSSALSVRSASPGKQMAPQHSIRAESIVSNDQANRFDLLRLPRELRDMVYRAWLDITDLTKDETAAIEDGGEFLHECRGYYVPFRSYIKYHVGKFHYSLEVMPSPCEFFNTFGSQVRHEAMQFIYRNHLLLDLKAKGCLRAFARWVEVFPLDATAVIENLKLIVSCRPLATGEFANTVVRTSSLRAFDVAKRDMFKPRSQQDIELDFCINPDSRPVPAEAS